jgi:2-hydroxy-3-oxopropionate reductase
MSMRVAFIGLGVMGRPMARRLVEAGFPVAVFNRSRPAVDALASEGARAADSVADAVSDADAIITMLPDGPDVEAVVAGSGGVLEHARPGALAIDMSTIAPAVARALHALAKKSGIRMLDAPVSGGDVGAQAGTLSIMVGGEAADVEEAQPLFAAMGRTITRCGPAGSGQLVKAANQIVVGIVLEAVSEALVFAERAGVDPAIVRQVLQGGLAQTRVMELKGPRMTARDFTPGFRAALHVKDLRIAQEEGATLGVRLPVAARVREMLATLVERGEGHLDHCAIFTIVEELSSSPADC